MALYSCLDELIDLIVSRKSYSFDPYANLSADQEHLVLGGQALLWSEQADPNNLDAIAWSV